MSEFIYSATDNLSALVTAQPELLLTLSHLGIPLGFGDKTIAQVCREHGVATEFFLLVTQVYCDDNYAPSQAVIKSTPMGNLIPYLMSSHDYYLNRGLPHIKGHLARIANMLPARAGKAIKQFFDAYVDEVRAHFAHEENTVYPHITRLLNHQSGDDYMIKEYLAHHDNLQDKLSDLVQIIFKYLPTSVQSYKAKMEPSPSSPSKIDSNPSSPSKIEGAGGSMKVPSPGNHTPQSLRDSYSILEEQLPCSITGESSPSKIEGAGGSMKTPSPGSVTASAMEKNITTDADNTIDMIFDILQLSRDLRKHSLIEEKILGPYVKQLEKHYSAR